MVLQAVAQPPTNNGFELGYEESSLEQLHQECFPAVKDKHRAQFGEQKNSSAASQSS